jgi:hypothetical protein
MQVVDFESRAYNLLLVQPSSTILISFDELKFPNQSAIGLMATLTRPDRVMELMETNLLAPKPHIRNSNTILHFITHILDLSACRVIITLTG